MDETQPRIAELHISAEPAAWQEAGFELAGGGLRLGSVLIRLDPDLDPSPAGGISAWTLAPGAPEPEAFGLPHAAPADVAEDPLRPGSGEHPNGAQTVDHVVVLAPDLERTIEDFEARGVRCRRLREVGPPDQLLRQAFFRFAEVILEAVEVPEEKAAPGGRPTFWGLTLVVTDLDAAAAMLGDKLGSIKDAVQPGRRIATVRREAGLGVPVALITPGSH